MSMSTRAVDVEMSCDAQPSTGFLSKRKFDDVNLEFERGGDIKKDAKTKFPSVKKYKRTAESDPDLIRPLSMLIKCMDDLLQLLDKPYDTDLLDLYNFLWDRMRAIRMDLRIQSICDPQAVSMLEQMIRLHIIAMHELCEYGKREGFDGNLNTEQLNKSFADLFQMYKDNRRKGMSFCTETEFCAYYALLNMDKHPGYKVEPADLALDLAKMSAEVRRSPEIAFARDVAKSCRSGNYISFFRLAKKATYLQACLMHAHFWKLRTEALASLHSSFLSNQGMPLARLENMLAMEGEDTESFAKHHGFVLKSFEEMYILKSGTFLRRGDPLCKRSPLVDAKRSPIMQSAVCFSLQTASTAAPKNEVSQESDQVIPAAPISTDPPIGSGTELEVCFSGQTVSNTTPKDEVSQEFDQVIPLPPISTDPLVGTSMELDVLFSLLAVSDTAEVSQECDQVIPPLSSPPPISSDTLVGTNMESDGHFPVRTHSNTTPKNVVSLEFDRVIPLLLPPPISTSTKDSEVEPSPVAKENTEVFRGKLKRIISTWKQRAMELRLLREKKEKESMELRLLREKNEREEALFQVAMKQMKQARLDKQEKSLNAGLPEIIWKPFSNKKFLLLYDQCLKVQEEIDKILYIYGLI